jgi:amidase
VTGIDINKDAIQIARKRHKDIHFEDGDITTIKGKYDIITLIEVIEHIKDVNKLILLLKDSLKKDGLKGKRLGLLKSSLGYHAKVDTLMKQAVAQLKSQGAEIVELDFSMDRAANGSSFQVLLYEFNDGLTKYFTSLGEKTLVKNLKELIEFNKKDSIELRYFDQKLLEMAAAKGDLTTKEYVDALALMWKATRENGIDKLLKENSLDALIAPTGSPAWKTDLIDGDHFIGGSSSMAAISGYPSITVPMGFIDELPVGISFFSTAWTESLLLEIAYGYEQSTKHRKAPKYIPSN